MKKTIIIAFAGLLLWGNTSSPITTPTLIISNTTGCKLIVRQGSKRVMTELGTFGVPIISTVALDQTKPFSIKVLYRKATGASNQKFKFDSLPATIKALTVSCHGNFVFFNNGAITPSAVIIQESSLTGLLDAIKYSE